MKTKTNNVVELFGRKLSDAESKIIPKDYKVPTGKKWLHARQVASKVIHDMYDAYTRKGGIADKQKELDTEKESLSNTMKAISDEAVKVAGNDMRLAAAHFFTLTGEAERGLREQHKDGDSVPTLIQLGLASWGTMKSMLAAAMIAGIPTTKMKTLGAVRTALRKHREATGTAGTSNRTGTGANRSRQGGFTEDLNRAMSVLGNVLKGLDEAGQNKAAVAVQEACAKIAKLHPKQADIPQVATSVLKAKRPARSRTRTPAPGTGSSVERVVAPAAASG